MSSVCIFWVGMFANQVKLHIKIISKCPRPLCDVHHLAMPKLTNLASEKQINKIHQTKMAILINDT